MNSDRLVEGDLQEALNDARDGWIADDFEGWLRAQSFYPGVADAINDLRAERCIITTKPQTLIRYCY